MLSPFFKKELEKFLTPALDPLGRSIIETCLRGNTPGVSGPCSHDDLTVCGARQGLANVRMHLLTFHPHQIPLLLQLFHEFQSWHGYQLH